MKRFLFGLFVCLLINGGIKAQNDNLYPTGEKVEYPEPFPLPDFPYQDGEVVYQEIYEFDADQQKLFGIALKYVSDYYKSAKAVIDVSDSDNGLVIAKGIFLIQSDVYYNFMGGTQKTSYQYDGYHTLKIETKDKKVRVTIDKLLLVTEANISEGIPRSETPINYMIEQYGIYETFKKPKKRELLAQVNRSSILHEIHLQSYNFLLSLKPYFEKELEDDW